RGEPVGHRRRGRGGILRALCPRCCVVGDHAHRAAPPQALQTPSRGGEPWPRRQRVGVKHLLALSPPEALPMMRRPFDPNSAQASDLAPELNLPGVRQLREEVARARRLPRAKTLREEALAGLTATIATVPDSLANGLLAGVNPL